MPDLNPWNAALLMCAAEAREYALWEARLEFEAGRQRGARNALATVMVAPGATAGDVRVTVARLYAVLREWDGVDAAYRAARDAFYVAMDEALAAMVESA